MNTDNRVKEVRPSAPLLPPQEKAKEAIVPIQGKNPADSPPLERGRAKKELPEREKHTQMRALREANKQVQGGRAHSLLAIDLSAAKRVAEETFTFRGDTSHVVAPDGREIEFKRAEVLGAGGESTAYDARVQERGKVYQRAFVQVGNFLEEEEMESRLLELKSFYGAINQKAPSSVRVYGFNQMTDEATDTMSVGILMDRGRPIFRGDPLPPGERVGFCEQFLAGVKEMHKNGITHGDIKVAIEGGRDSSNLMMRWNEEERREPCLIDWGESVDHGELSELEAEAAFQRVAWKVTSPAFTPYGLGKQLKEGSNRLNPRLVTTPKKRSQQLEIYFELRKKLDLFNTAVAIVQILNGHEEAYCAEVIRVEGATRGEPEPQVQVLLKNIPEDIPPKLKKFLQKTLRENFEK